MKTERSLNYFHNPSTKWGIFSLKETKLKTNLLFQNKPELCSDNCVILLKYFGATG